MDSTSTTSTVAPVGAPRRCTPIALNLLAFAAFARVFAKLADRAPRRDSSSPEDQPQGETMRIGAAWGYADRGAPA
eukprot:521341-Rhodomonas_salina.1